MQRRPRLEGKIAIITGAGSSGPGVGVGKATSILFAREGAKVLLVDRSAENVEETLAQIHAESSRDDWDGGEASTFVADVTRADDCRALVEAAQERYGRPNVLVNNVAISTRGTVVTLSEEDWDRTLDVNLKSMMLVSKYAVPAMIEGGGGSIVNISSTEALRAGSVSPIIAYNAAKGGVISLTTAMAVHHGRDQVRVNCIAPGFLYTPLIAPRLTEETREMRRLAAPLGTEGSAWDIAWAALFLASDEARWISGIVLPVDAGLLTTTPISSLLYPR
jgi:NAD(P)-dependent dehydrogenase (short-subunit alcohol dehydrogenase family)